MSPAVSPARRPNRRWVRVLLRLSVFVVLTGILEMGLRVTLSQQGRTLPDPFVEVIPPGSEVTDSRTHHAAAPNTRRVREPGVHDSFSPVVSETNAQGLRGPMPGPKQSPRVLVVGDSFIEADEVAFEATIGERLNAEFDGRLEVVSHGVSSWAPTTEFSWIHHVGLTFEPDAVVLFLVFNDFFPADTYGRADPAYQSEALWRDGAPIEYVVPAEKQRRDSPTLTAWRTSAEALVRRSRVGVLAALGLQSIAAWWSPPLSEQAPTLFFAQPRAQWPRVLRRSVDDTLTVVVRLNEYLRQRGVALRVTMVPSGFNWPDELMGVKDFDASWGQIVEESGVSTDAYALSDQGLEVAVAERLVREGVEWFSLRPAFASAKAAGSGLLYNEEDGHWNARGHRVVADALSPWLATLVDS